jgi:hypothetical protein
MKKILILLLATMCSCGQDDTSEKTYPISYNTDIGHLKLVNIDSCEYLYGEWGSATVLTHKGNCKYCTQRIKH